MHKPRLSRTLRYVLALVTALPALLIGCGAPPPEPTVPPTPTPGASAPPEGTTALPSAPPTAGRSGLAGLVIAASDVAGRADTPLADQLVLAVAIAQTDTVLSLGGRPPTDEELRFLKAHLPTAGPAISTTISAADGGYALELAPGTYVVCLADSEQQPPAFPATTRGCARVEVPAGALRTVDLSSGFGEMLAIER